MYENSLEYMEYFNRIINFIRRQVDCRKVNELSTIGCEIILKNAVDQIKMNENRSMYITVLNFPLYYFFPSK